LTVWKKNILRINIIFIFISDNASFDIANIDYNLDGMIFRITRLENDQENHTIKIIAIEETKGIKIDRTAILWLKASTRGADKSGKKLQGKGWELKVVDEIEKNFELFKLIYRLYEIENPTTEPKFSSYPTTIKL
jgi:hypothetical protein